MTISVQDELKRQLKEDWDDNFLTMYEVHSEHVIVVASNGAHYSYYYFPSSGEWGSFQWDSLLQKKITQPS